MSFMFMEFLLLFIMELKTANQKWILRHPASKKITLFKIEVFENLQIEALVSCRTKKLQWSHPTEQFANLLHGQWTLASSWNEWLSLKI